MKLKVIGWTHYEDTRFPEGEYSHAAEAAIIAAICECGFEFTGWHHQEALYGAPVLNDGCIYRYSQRGWGRVMAEAHGMTAPMDYAYYAFLWENPEDATAPTWEYSVWKKIDAHAKDLLTFEENEYLYEDSVTTCFPHPELGERGIYTLTDEERETVEGEGIVRQVPEVVYRALFGGDLRETFVLDETVCRREDDKIVLPLTPDLYFIAEGDFVTLGDKTYPVGEVLEYRDVSRDVENAALYTFAEGHKDAVEAYKRAPRILKITI